MRNLRTKEEEEGDAVFHGRGESPVVFSGPPEPFSLVLSLLESPLNVFPQAGVRFERKSFNLSDNIILLHRPVLVQVETRERRVEGEGLGECTSARLEYDVAGEIEEGEGEGEGGGQLQRAGIGEVAASEAQL